MTPKEWHQVTAVFHQALAHEPARRGAFLEEACAGVTAVRDEVQRLLAAHEAAGQFGDTPVVFGSASAMSLTPAPSPDATTFPARRRHPFLIVIAAAAVFALAFFAYAAWLLLIHGGRSASLGWQAAERQGAWHVVAVDRNGPASPALTIGDRVVSVNGALPFTVFSPASIRSRLEPGTSYEVVINRAGQQLVVALTVGSGPSRLSSRLAHFVSSLFWVGIGLWIGAARPDNAVGRLAAAVSVSVGLLFLTVGTIDGAAVWAPLHVVLGYHFFARFPAGDPVRGLWKRALVALYAIGGVSVAVAIAFHGALATGAAPTAVGALLRAREVTSIGAFAGAVMAMLAVVPHNYRRLATNDQRRRVKWVIYATFVGLAPEVWWALVSFYELFFGTTPVPKFTLAANIVPVVIPMSVAYVVIRHRVLDIKVVVRRTVQYLVARRVLQAAVVVPLVALAYTIAGNRHLTIAELVTGTSGYIYPLVAAALALRFRRRIEAWLDRRFFREQSDRDQLLLGLLDDVGKVASIGDLSGLVSERLLSALHPTHAHLWYRDPEELAAACSSNPVLAPADVPASDRWLRWLESQSGPVDLPLPPDAAITRAESQWFTDRAITLIVPIIDAGDQLVGAILVGEKKSQEPYTVADRRLLSAVAKQAAVVRENLRLRARVKDDARVRHDVLARLDGRVPDLLKECPACGQCYEGDVARCDADGRTLILSLPVSRTLNGRYRLDRLIGSGGMGAVYEACDLRLARTVAVKVMLGRAFGHPGAMRRFRREARLAAQLSHPNIVAVHDVGVLAGDGAYLVMERVHGGTLRAALEREKRLAPATAANWFGPALDGLAAAHDAGIIHRDLKPENVMGKSGDSGALDVKILDLGLAKLRADDTAASSTVTADGVVMGTIGYMSPEQLRGRDLDERTDIYAVGVMVVEALTGIRPQPEHPLRLTFGTSAEALGLSRLLESCLEREARARYSSARALRAELIPLLRGWSAGR